jgi:sec-independent protein translocase protein TatC
MLSHLLELRRRLIYIFCLYVALFAVFYYFSESVFNVLMMPLLQALPEKGGLIASEITSPLLTPLKLGANCAFIISFPFALYQMWRFLSPGLYSREKETLRFTILLSILLFLAGALFCFYFVLPYMMQFFANSVPANVRYFPDMTNTLDFITRMLIIFGLCFQVPLLCYFCVRINLLELKTLKNIRPYIIVGAFVVGMLLTPPDVISQIMLAIPLCLLYELGIVLALLFKAQPSP